MPTVFEAIRQMSATSFMALPLMLICYTFFMGFGLGNLGLIMLLLGQITVVPLVTFASEKLFSSSKIIGIIAALAASALMIGLEATQPKDAVAPPPKPSNASGTISLTPEDQAAAAAKLSGFMAAGIFIAIPILLAVVFLYYTITGYTTTIPNYDVCNLVPSAYNKGVPLNIVPSFWMAQLLFFVGYLLQNAMALYNQPVSPGSMQSKVDNRKEQAITAISVTIIISLVFVLVRLRTGCENPLGIFVAIMLMIPLGVGWYFLAASLTGFGSADVFGIASQILSSDARKPATQVCVNTSI